MKRSAFSMLQYSALSLSFLSMKEGASQAVYTDVDPDIILDTDGEIAGIDMDNEGVLDFIFRNSIGTVSTSSTDITYIERIWVGPNIVQNGVAGYSSYQSGSGGFTIYFPYAINYGDNIGPDLPFHNWWFQRMAFRDYTHHFPSLGTGTWAGGYWYPEKIDHFVGIKFLDSEGDYHYGWIRCDVKDEGRTLVIKDYAYESKPNVLIAAGDMIGNMIEFAYEKGDIHTSVAENELQGVTVYSFDHTVFINLNDLAESPNVRIINLIGEVVYEDGLKELHTKISLHEIPKGNYIVQVIGSGKRFSKKIYIN